MDSLSRKLLISVTVTQNGPYLRIDNRRQSVISATSHFFLIKCAYYLVIQQIKAYIFCYLTIYDHPYS